MTIAQRPAQGQRLVVQLERAPRVALCARRRTERSQHPGNHLLLLEPPCQLEAARQQVFGVRVVALFAGDGAQPQQCLGGTPIVAQLLA